MSKIRSQDCAIEVRTQRGEIIPAVFYVNGHALFKGNIPLESKKDIHQYIYEEIFDNCPLTWADFCKVKIHNRDFI